MIFKTYPTFGEPHHYVPSLSSHYCPSHKHRFFGGMALGDSYRNGITSAERFSKLNALSHAKKDVISANGGTAFRVLFNFITPEAKSGLNLIVLFCEGLAVSVFSHFYGASTSSVKTTFF